MKTIKVTSVSEIPKNFTGIVEDLDGAKRWYKEGNLHREDGPAVENSHGTKKWYKEGKLHRADGPACEWADEDRDWYLEGNFYKQINPNDYIILDYFKGEDEIVWYKILTKDEIVEYPDIPGLIEK